MILRVALIVEGDGDRSAVPHLIRKICHEHMIFDLEITSRPIKAKGVSFLRRQGELEKFVKYKLGDQPDAIFLVLDCDDDCPVDVASEFLTRVSGVVTGNVEFHVALIVREFESFFLLSLESITHTFSAYDWDASRGINVKARGAKEALDACMAVSYKEMIHQEKFVHGLDLNVLRESCRCYRHLEKAVLDVASRYSKSFASR